jgi:DNA-directed RNA polymerase subunit RPC12/RpoP
MKDKMEFEVCVKCGKKISSNQIIIKGETYCNDCAMNKIQEDRKDIK